MGDLNLRTEQVGSVTVATIGPEFETIDEPALERLASFLLSLTENKDLKKLVIDLSETTFFGSGLLAIILRVYSRLSARGGQMALCGLRPHCRQVLETTRLDTLWPVYATRAEAVQQVAGDGPGLRHRPPA